MAPSELHSSHSLYTCFCTVFSILADLANVLIKRLNDTRLIVHSRAIYTAHGDVSQSTPAQL